MRGRPHRLFSLAVPGGRVVAAVAARQRRAPAFGRRTRLRRYCARVAAACAPVVALVVGIAFTGALGIVTTTPAAAQGFTYNPRPPRPDPRHRAAEARQ